MLTDLYFLVFQFICLANDFLLPHKRHSEHTVTSDYLVCIDKSLEKRSDFINYEKYQNTSAKTKS